MGILMLVGICVRVCDSNIDLVFPQSSEPLKRISPRSPSLDGSSTGGLIVVLRLLV
jgi:hypothetical protein